jgi:hypothetical protein
MATSRLPPHVLPPNEVTDEDIAALVGAWMEHLDARPRNPMWRYRALGTTVAQAVADAPVTGTVTLHPPHGELRVVRKLARDRQLDLATYIRRLVGSMLVVAEDVKPDHAPWWTKDGLITPWRPDDRRT